MEVAGEPHVSLNSTSFPVAELVPAGHAAPAGALIAVWA
jgi:hypothetical protein